MARQLILVVNPLARGATGARWRHPVANALRETGTPVQVHEPGSAEEATELARAASADDVLVTLGGDGLIARIAQGVIESGAAIAPLPAGRGNDLCRALGIPRDPAAAARALPHAVERRIDVGVVENRIFLGIASLGFDSVANAIANRTRRPNRAIVYALSGIRALTTATPRRFLVTVDGVLATVHGWNVAVGNSDRYGGGLKMCPDASIDDGLLDVVAVTAIPRWRFFVLLPQVFFGRHIRGSAARTFRGREVQIACDDDLLIYADGDPIGALPATLTVRPQALRVIGGS